MSTQLNQIAKKAKSNPKWIRFSSLTHLLTPEFLTETWKQMNRSGEQAVLTVETTKEFEQDLDTRVQELMRTLEARGLSEGSTGAPSGDTEGPGKAGTRGRSEFRRSKIACCYKERSRGSWKRCVRGRFPGVLVWISARM